MTVDLEAARRLADDLEHAPRAPGSAGADTIRALADEIERLRQEVADLKATHQDYDDEGLADEWD